MAEQWVRMITIIIVLIIMISIPIGFKVYEVLSNREEENTYYDKRRGN
jgi:hypothetical protein